MSDTISLVQSFQNAVSKHCAMIIEEQAKLSTLQSQHNELLAKQKALESVFQDAQTERDMHIVAYDELRALVKNMLDEEAKDNPLHPVKNNDGFCPFYTPLAKAINWKPTVKERDLAK